MVVAGVTAALPPAHRRATRSAGDCVAFRKPDSSVRSETPFLVVHIMRDGQTDFFERAVIWNSTESGNVARNSSNASTAQSTRCWLNALNAHRQILAVKLSASGEAGRRGSPAARRAACRRFPGNRVRGQAQNSVRRAGGRNAPVSSPLTGMATAWRDAGAESSAASKGRRTRLQ